MKESLLVESDASVPHLSQQAAYHPEVSEEVKKRALMFGSECTTGYIDLLEHVLLVGGVCVCVCSRWAQVVANFSQIAAVFFF